MNKVKKCKVILYKVIIVVISIVGFLLFYCYCENNKCRAYRDCISKGHVSITEEVPDVVNPCSMQECLDMAVYGSRDSLYYNIVGVYDVNNIEICNININHYFNKSKTSIEINYDSPNVSTSIQECFLFRLEIPIGCYNINSISINGINILKLNSESEIWSSMGNDLCYAYSDSGESIVIGGCVRNNFSLSSISIDCDLIADLNLSSLLSFGNIGSKSVVVIKLLNAESVEVEYAEDVWEEIDNNVIKTYRSRNGGCHGDDDLFIPNTLSHQELVNFLDNSFMIVL